MILSKNRIGVAVGLFFAVIHAIWSLVVAIMPNLLQDFMDFVTLLHTIKPFIIITSFNIVNAVILIGITFVFGYLLGALYAWAHNLSHKK